MSNEHCISYVVYTKEVVQFFDGVGMNKKYINCWEFKKCGREPGGDNVEELGVCRTTTEKSIDGIHHGDNAGRCCWIISGTFCAGKVQGTYAEKLGNCANCNFFRKVLEEEGISLADAKDLLTILEIVSR